MGGKNLLTVGVILLACLLNLNGLAREITTVDPGLIVPDGILTEWPPDLFGYFPHGGDTGPRWAICTDQNFLHLAIQVTDADLTFSSALSQVYLSNDAIRLYLASGTDEYKLSISYLESLNKTLVSPNLSWLWARLTPSSEGYQCEISISRSILTSNRIAIQLVLLDVNKDTLEAIYTLNGILTHWEDSSAFLTFSLK